MFIAPEPRPLTDLLRTKLSVTEARTMADDFGRRADLGTNLYDRLDSGGLDSRINALVAEAERVNKMQVLDDVIKAVRPDLAPALDALPRVPVDPPLNPFIYGPAVPPEHFYGRQEQIAAVKNRIGGRTAQSISIIGLRRHGKSSLLRYINERHAAFFVPSQKPVVVPLDFSRQHFHTPVGVYEGLRRGIARATGTAPWQSAENDDPYCVEDGLIQVRDAGHRLVVLIDEFEAIGARLGAFQDWGDDWRSKASGGLFTLAIASTQPLTDVYKSHGLTSPFGNIFTTTTLGAFAQNEWHKLVNECYATDNRQPTAADLAFIDALAGGLPFYTQMAAGLLWQYRDYAVARETFVREVQSHFVTLWKNLPAPARHALRHAAGMPHLAPSANGVVVMLKQHGLLRADGRLFGSAFADFVKEQQ